MPDNVLFEDIFEAVRHLEPGSPVLNLKDKKVGYLKRDLRFNLLDMQNGFIGAFPINMMFNFFRGENEDYDLRYPCIPSIYRVRKPEERAANGYRDDEYILT